MLWLLFDCVFPRFTVGLDGGLSLVFGFSCGWICLIVGLAGDWCLALWLGIVGY